MGEFPGGHGQTCQKNPKASSLIPLKLLGACLGLEGAQSGGFSDPKPKIVSEWLVSCSFQTFPARLATAIGMSKALNIQFRPRGMAGWGERDAAPHYTFACLLPPKSPLLTHPSQGQ